MNFDTNAINPILSIVVMAAGIIVYIIRMEGKYNLMTEKFKHASELITHLVDEGKNIKLIQGGYSNDSNAIKITIVRIEEKQDATISDIKEIKKILDERRDLFKYLLESKDNDHHKHIN